MATTKESNVFSEASALSGETSIPPIPPDPPPDPKADHTVDDIPGMNKDSQLATSSLTTFGTEKDSGVGSPSTPGAGTPDKPLVETIDFIPKGDERILFVDFLSSEFNCAKFFEIFGKYGEIKVIRFCETMNFEFWRIWIEFAVHEDALSAFKDSSHKDMKCKLLNKYPPKLDVDIIYPKRTNEEGERNLERSPLPARWNIIITKSDSSNIFHLRKHLIDLVGPISAKDITRFGKNSFLVYTKSHRKGHMISKIKNTDMIKEVKPHFSFSYGKGVLFNQDVYDLSETELLDMCDDRVWKFFKVPRTKMTIFTFKTDEVPEHIFIERERFRIRTYREKPLQCYKCFGFGHSSKKCEKEQICALCSLTKHDEDCTRPMCCINCNGSHSARYKECEAYRKEMAAVEKAHAEHLSIGQAKRLLFVRPQYSSIVKGSDGSKDQHKKPSRIPNPQLSSSQFEIHPASQLPFKRAPLPLSHGASQASSEVPRVSSEVPRASSGAPQASLEASQAESLPDVGSSQNNTLKNKTHRVEVHEVEMELQRPKRSLSPSPPPAKSSNHGGKNRIPKKDNSRSHEDLSVSSSTKQRPNISRLTKHISGIPKKRFNL